MATSCKTIIKCHNVTMRKLTCTQSSNLIHTSVIYLHSFVCIFSFTQFYRLCRSAYLSTQSGYRTTESQRRSLTHLHVEFKCALWHFHISSDISCSLLRSYRKPKVVPWFSWNPKFMFIYSSPLFSITAI